MNVIISGQAGAWAVLSKTAVLYDLAGRSFELSSGDLSFAFRGCTDVRALKVRSKEEALEACRGLRNNDRALRFVLHLLDDDTEDRLELAEAIERLFEVASVADFVSASLYVDALPNTATIEAVLASFEEFPHLSRVLAEVLRDQPIIRRVRELFEDADTAEFENERAYRSFRHRILQSTIQRDLVHLIRDGKSIEFFLLN